jgi:hypothetical protein
VGAGSSLSFHGEFVIKILRMTLVALKVGNQTCTFEFALDFTKLVPENELRLVVAYLSRELFVVIMIILIMMRNEENMPTKVPNNFFYPRN